MQRKSYRRHLQLRKSFKREVIPGMCRVPTVVENPGKKVVMESYEKVMENSKNLEFHGNLFARKKVIEMSWKSVVLIVFLLCCDQCGSRLYSSVSLITMIRI